jgi:hypothetical protein
MQRQKNNLKSWWVFLFLTVLIPRIIAAEAFGALLVNTNGNVSIITKKGKSILALPGLQLEKGDMVITGENSSAAVILASGNDVRHIPPASRFQVKKNVKSKHYSKLFSLVSEAVHPYRERIEVQEPIVRDSRGKINSLAVRPGGTSIMSQRPTFKWQKVKGVDKFILKLMDEEGQILWKKETTDCYVDYPHEVPGLSYDKSYFLQVEAIAGGQEIISEITHIQVLNAIRIEEVKRAQKFYETEPLVLTSIYIHYKLKDLAISKLEQMVKKEPGNKHFITMLKRLYLKKRYFQNFE